MKLKNWNFDLKSKEQSSSGVAHSGGGAVGGLNSVKIYEIFNIPRNCVSGVWGFEMAKLLNSLAYPISS